jgi:hypothetical protein
MKLRHCLLFFSVSSSLILATSMPARAESKLSQCKRFGQTIEAYADQLVPQILQTVDATSAKTYVAALDKALATSQKGLKKMEGRRFADRQLTSFHTQSINLYTDLHNSFVGMANAVESRDRDAYRTAAQKLKPILLRERQLLKQFSQHCSKP